MQKTCTSFAGLGWTDQTGLERVLLSRLSADPPQFKCADLKTLPGISQPFPNMFDPLNLARTASIKDVRRWRESEITHGRVAMLAALGFIVGEQLEDFPAFVNFDGHITGK